jgi:MFS family permease
MNTDSTFLKAKPYAYFLLLVLTIIYILNFIDRMIISILAEEIKASLHVDDASLGFLYGTAFAVFFSIFGIPFARLADMWSRKKLVGFGVFVWSIMSALSGTANSFALLALYRVGVGVGESAAAPASLSMLADSFTKNKRATVFGVWSTGVFIGSGLGFAIGGATISLYHKWFPDGNAPFGIADWQLSMFMVGLPGLIMAVIMLMMREPKRGLMDGHETEQQHPHALKFFMRELAAVVPPFTVISLYELDGGARLVRQNIIFGILLIVMASILSYVLGDPVQWITISLGLYSFTSWLQRLKIIDYPCYSMVFKEKAMRYSVLGFSLIGFTSYGLGFWFAPYIIRRFESTPQDVGAIMGIIVFSSGILSIILGGLMSDMLKKHTPKARPLMGMVSLLALPLYALAVMSTHITEAYMFAALGIFFGMIWIPSALAMASELSPPRMRATAIAFNQLAGTLLGLAMGPYAMGKISDILRYIGYEEADGLRWGMMLAMGIVAPISLALLYSSSRFVEGEEKTVFERAKAFGEK